MSPLLSPIAIAALLLTPLSHRAPAPVYSVGCRVTLQARNEGGRVVVLRLGASRWKHRGGLWNRFASEADWPIAADGKDKSRAFELSLPCSAGERQYEFELMSNDNERVVRFPGADDYSGTTTIALGNVARHF